MIKSIEITHNLHNIKECHYSKPQTPDGCGLHRLAHVGIILILEEPALAAVDVGVQGLEADRLAVCVAAVLGGLAGRSGHETALHCYLLINIIIPFLIKILKLPIKQVLYSLFYFLYFYFIFI